MASRRERLARLKTRLYEKLREHCSLEEVAEWAWEDFGVRVKSWDDVKSLVFRDEVAIGDLVSFLAELEVELTEEDLGITEEDLREALGS
ncbi:MAG: hypothetical protein QXS85_03090 [Acidilobaceae archaeon]